MKPNLRKLWVGHRLLTLLILIAALTATSGVLRADNGTCNGAGITLPFADVAGNTFFCQIAEAYFSGLTNGTSATTYSPSDFVTRQQMAAFITRTLDQSLARGSRRAALKQWQIPQSNYQQKKTQVGVDPRAVASDGEDLWVTNSSSNTISRVRGKDGKLLETWTGASDVKGICVAGGRVYAAGFTSNRLFIIDPSQPPGPVTSSTAQIEHPLQVATDGLSIWTANEISVSKVSSDGLVAQTFHAGFQGPSGILYDGASIWVADRINDSLKKLD